MRIRYLLIAMALPNLAVAAPIEFGWQGRILDSVGSPLHGSHGLQLALYDDALGTDPLNDLLFQEDFGPMTLEGGFVSLTLGSGTPSLNSDVLDVPEVWVEIRVDGQAQSPRVKLLSVPRAAVSTDLDGGVAHLGGTADACDVGRLGTIQWTGTEFHGCTDQGWVTLVTEDASDNLEVPGLVEDSRSYYHRYT